MTDVTDRQRQFVAECCEVSVGERLAELEPLDGETTGHGDDVAVLSALANETRYGLVRTLVAADGELCVCELHPLFDVSESAVSHGLSKLRTAGLVARRRDGKWHHYRATPLAERLVGALDGSDGPAPEAE